METFYKEEGNTGKSKVVLTESNRQLIGCRGFDFFCFVYSHFPDSTLKDCERTLLPPKIDWNNCDKIKPKVNDLWFNISHSLF